MMNAIIESLETPKSFQRGDAEARRIEKFGALSEQVIGAALEVHRELGPGLPEAVYEDALAHEFALQSISFERQKPLPVCYKQISLDASFRVDFIVENVLIVELKAVEALLPVHHAQLLSYLRLTQLGVGLLVNFNVDVLRKGLKRISLSSNLRASVPPR